MKRLILGFAVAIAVLIPPPSSAQQCSTPECIVTQERAKFPTPLSDTQAATLMRAIAARLNAAGIPGGPFGVLIKTTGASCDGISCDIICSGQGATQRQWDVLRDSNDPQWGEVDNITVRLCEINGPGPLPVPHEYDGGDNDTGICDICGLPRSAAIHAGPPPAPACIACETALERARIENATLRTQMNTLTQELGAQIQRLQTDLQGATARAELAEAEIARRDANPPRAGCEGQKILWIKTSCRAFIVQ